MSVTININGLSLCHKGSNGISTATVPDVCKTPTPGGPVPMPYPNISMSSDLANGTTTVTADGGNMIAIKGSDFSRSTGDEPGTIGGVKSNVNMKASKWILYSMDVKFDGENACRLTDKKTQNNENTVDATGLVQILIPKTQLEKRLARIAKRCKKKIDTDKKFKKETCTVRGTRKHKCCKDAVDRIGDPNVRAEYVHKGVPDCRLDVALLSGGNVKTIYDFKFNCSGKPRMSSTQAEKYWDEFGAKIKLIGG